MRVLVAAMPFAGHVLPMTAVAAELVGRGREVVAHTGARYGPRFESTGAQWLPWEQAPDFDEADLRATFPQVGDGRGARAVTANLEHVFLRTAAGQARDILAAGPFDVLVSDNLALGAALAGARTGTPWATVSLFPLGMPSRDLPPFGLGLRPGRGPLVRARDATLRTAVAATLLRRLDRVLADVCGSLDLPAMSFVDAGCSPQLVVAHGVPELEYPRSDLPQQVHFVGQLAPPPSGRSVPDWWSELLADPRSLVHVTQGTYDVDPDDLLLPALAGLASLDVQVAAATGGAPLPGNRVPSNARQAGFLPYDQLLPRASAVVTNGGWGGVLASLAAGVPLVVAGGTLDKPEIARRIAASGAGIDLRTGRPSPGSVREAVQRLLAEPGYRVRAGEIGRSLARHGGVAAAADLVERLAATRAPVPRRETAPLWPVTGANRG